MVCSGINEPARTEFARYLWDRRHCSLDDYLDSLIDIRNIEPAYVGPSLAPGVDVWGVKRSAFSFGSGAYDEIEYYPLADFRSPADLARHSWPNPDMYDYDVLPRRIAAVQTDGERCIMVTNGNIFETTWYMRGFQQIFMDMVQAPEMVHAIMGRVTDFYVAHFRKMLAAARGQIDLVFTADDIAGQKGLLVSPEMWEAFIKPYHVRLNAAIHEHDARVIYHSDGAVMRAIPGLIDMGIDVLQALQFDAAGMDPVAMKALYGDRLCFEGGVSVQQTLPFGTPDQVRVEVERLIAVLGRDGGYILGPSHNIQAGTPAENIYAMFETALSFYSFT
jgi:uroporphyrinogen decarboxylase